MRRLRFSIVCPLLLLASCASSVCLTPTGGPSITPSAVSATRGHVGTLTQWGGTLIGTRHRKDNTEFEVIAYPLDDCGRPRAGSKPTGRFIIVYPGFLETTNHRIGQEISVTGRIIGIRAGQLGGVDYSFPLLQNYKVHPWPDRQQAHDRYSRPWINIGIGGRNSHVFGGVRVVL